MTSSEESLLARLEAVISGLDRANRESQRELNESLSSRAEVARRGGLGSDWQEIQRRVDAGQTSARDVFTGRDGSAEAQRLVQVSRQTLAHLAESAPDEVRQELDEERAAAEEQWGRLRRETEGRA